MILGTVTNVVICFGLLFLVPAVTSIYRRRKRIRLVRYQVSIQTSCEASWIDSEELVGEIYGRKISTVQENMSGGADVNIDLLILKTVSFTI